MIGKCNSKIKKVTIEIISGETMRSIASSLMKSSNDDVFLLFIQKTDKDTSTTGESYSCEIEFKRSISL